jgi:hypothetical protein
VSHCISSGAKRGRRNGRSPLNPPHTLPQEGVAERMKPSVPAWNIQVPTLSREIGVPTGPAHSADPLHQLVFTSPVSRSKTTKNHSKTAPLCSFRPFLASRLPTSLLAIRGDLRVFPYPKSQQNTRITTYSEHKRGSKTTNNHSKTTPLCSFRPFYDAYQPCFAVKNKQKSLKNSTPLQL